MTKKNPEGTNVNPPCLLRVKLMNQARDLAHKLAQKLANAALFKAAGQARFKTGTILPVYGRLLSN
jgi:hypothetical protein